MAEKYRNLYDNSPDLYRTINPGHLIEKMFEILFTTRQIGTGLGLVSCKSVTKNMVAPLR
ncbi:MAG: hypothetical protein ACYC6W_08130 [Nitrosotalea sp.]